MSYLVLARKYRPRTFADMVGQEAVTSVLAGAIAEDRVGHAYIFSGPRGTGKTTTARIVAKALNCEQGPTPEPCGTCDRCVGCDAGNELDVVEIDAASNNGVEYVRSLREQVGYAPAVARFKIYIVDEVHMMSKGAFNALLKTLEEPPPHVKFLFATTELHKVPDTILSRCQVLRLSPIKPEHIARRLDQVFAAENIEAEAGVSAQIATRSRGGMRDALSFADQLLALAGANPTLADVERVGGSGPAGTLALLENVAAGDRAALLARTAEATGREGELVDALLATLRTAIVAAHCGADSPLVEGDGEGLAAFAQRLGAARCEAWLAELVRTKERMRLSHGIEDIVLESALLELARGEEPGDFGELLDRLAALEARLVAGGAGPAPPAPARPTGADRGAGSAPAPRAAAPTPAPAAVDVADVDVADVDVADVDVADVDVAEDDLAEVDVAKGDVAGSAVASAPAVESAPRAEPPSPAPPSPEPQHTLAPAAPRPRDDAEAFARALALIERARPSLADLLRRGRVSRDGDALTVALLEIDDTDRHLLDDARSMHVARSAVQEAFGAALQLAIIQADRRGAEAAPPDDFTAHVVDLFGGRIEEAPRQRT